MGNFGKERTLALPALVAAASSLLALTASTTALSKPGLSPNGLSIELAPASLLVANLEGLLNDEVLSVDGDLIHVGALQPARPFRIVQAGSATQRRSLDCLAAAVYHEARSEGEAGQRAVAQVVLNRVRHPSFPATVCGVVFQGAGRRTGCQFTFTCDGSLRRRRVPAAWEEALQIAEEALAGRVYAPVGTATHYHTNQVNPYWAGTLTRITELGAHIFYRWRGAPGELNAFTRYPAPEPAVALAAAEPSRGRTETRLAAAVTAPAAPVEKALPAPLDAPSMLSATGFSWRGDSRMSIGPAS